MLFSQCFLNVFKRFFCVFACFLISPKRFLKSSLGYVSPCVFACFLTVAKTLFYLRLSTTFSSRYSFSFSYVFSCVLCTFSCLFSKSFSSFYFRFHSCFLVFYERFHVGFPSVFYVQWQMFLPGPSRVFEVALRCMCSCLLSAFRPVFVSFLISILHLPPLFLSLRGGASSGTMPGR